MRSDYRRQSLCLAVLLVPVLLVSALGEGRSSEAPQAVRPVLLANGVVLVRDAEVIGTVGLPDSTRARKLERLAGGWILGGERMSSNGSELFLWRHDGEQAREFEGPLSPEQPPLRREATPLVRDGSLAGLLWLEGERHNRLAVRAAAWTAAGWGPSEPVSVPGPGSQVAVSGTVLGDGSWLAVWTWVDTQGDAETVWSLRRNGHWSEPQRIHEDNLVHDVQPVLAGLGDRALVVWSSFDGNDYRMRRARFDGSSWRASGFFGGRGAGDPVLEAETQPGGSGGRFASLRYVTVAPSTWSFVDFNAGGEAIAEGVLERESRDFGPVLLARDVTGAPELIWPALGPEFPERRSPVDLAPLALADRLSGEETDGE
ncbi:MAG: hypothetical protein ACE5GX_06715 [Thermoanaerobaculia bacterium]